MQKWFKFYLAGFINALVVMLAGQGVTFITALAGVPWAQYPLGIALGVLLGYGGCKVAYRIAKEQHE